MNLKLIIPIFFCNILSGTEFFFLLHFNKEIIDTSTFVKKIKSFRIYQKNVSHLTRYIYQHHCQEKNCAVKSWGYLQNEFIYHE